MRKSRTEYIQTKVLGSLITFRVVPRTELSPSYYVEGKNIVNSFVFRHLDIKKYKIGVPRSDASLFFLRLMTPEEMLEIDREDEKEGADESGNTESRDGNV